MIQSQLLYRCIFLIFFVLKISTSTLAKDKITVSGLTTNHFNNPGGVLHQPLFSWKLASNDKGIAQSAYQIIVSSSQEGCRKGTGDIWDTKKVKSNKQLNIPFEGKNLESSKVYYWRIRVWDNDGKVSNWSKPASFISGLLNEKDFNAKWIFNNHQKDQAMPLFKKSFNLKDKSKNSIIHISGLGYYELYVNGKKIGDHVLDPGQTNYDDYAFYVTYNIDTLLQKGENVIGVMLGDGWYNQDVVWGGQFVYGNPMFWCQLDMPGASISQIISDTSWQWTPGPILASNIYGGEVYDATKEVANWAKPDQNNANWKAVELAPNHPTVLKPQDIQPIKKMAELPVKKVFKSPKGSYVFDMGQNFSGWNRLKIQAPRGTIITMRMAEELYEDSTLNFSTTGDWVTKVIQTEKYICKGGGVEVWEPRFTYHGFRYVEVDGLTVPPNKDLLTGIVVYSSVPDVGTFTCSDAQINKLHQLSYWTMISNLHSIPTDCPHREKCGWLGDAHAMGPSTIYNFDMQNFWLKYMDDIHSTAKKSGNTIFHLGKNKFFRNGFKEAGIPYMVAPGKRLPGAASPDWGTAIVQLPWFLYTYYGNESALRKFYPDMKQWVNHVDALAKENIVYEGLGDWCPPGDIDNIDCPIALSSTAFHYNDLIILKKVAGIIGNQADSLTYHRKAENVKKAFISKFYNQDLNSYGSHTANALALDFGLIPAGKEKLVAAAIVKTSKEQFHGFMYAGIFGLQRLFDQLSRFGQEKAAYDILTKKGDHSFAMMWDQFDATTLWEVLPVNPDFLKLKLEKTLRRSHNHPMQAGFDAWFFYGIAGIKTDLNTPGFKRIILEPQLINELQYAEGSYQSPYGKIQSDWKWVNEQLVWKVSIPVNTTAQLKLPAGLFGNYKIDELTNNILKKDEAFVKELYSGDYELVFNRIR